jgi:hypothetical protein
MMVFKKRFHKSNSLGLTVTLVGGNFQDRISSYKYLVPVAGLPAVLPPNEDGNKYKLAY